MIGFPAGDVPTDKLCMYDFQSGRPRPDGVPPGDGPGEGERGVPVDAPWMPGGTRECWGVEVKLCWLWDGWSGWGG